MSNYTLPYIYSILIFLSFERTLIHVLQYGFSSNCIKVVPSETEHIVHVKHSLCQYFPTASV